MKKALIIVQNYKAKLVGSLLGNYLENKENLSLWKDFGPYNKKERETSLFSW